MSAAVYVNMCAAVYMSAAVYINMSAAVYTTWECQGTNVGTAVCVLLYTLHYVRVYILMYTAALKCECQGTNVGTAVLARSCIVCIHDVGTLTLECNVYSSTQRLVVILHFSVMYTAALNLYTLH